MDQISNLPDCLLHHILSFLETKESVRMSILSKKWINVWKSLPRLDLRAADFNQVQNFVDFGNSILHDKLFPNPEKLDTVSLMWGNMYIENISETINTWIYNLVSLKPRVVNIEIFMSHDKMDFLSYLFNCSSLESMSLCDQSLWVLGPSDLIITNLPFLKRLYLGFLHLKDEFTERIVSGCPILEELEFDNCCFHGSIRITSSTLKKLIIHGANFNYATILRISVPNLVHLKCEAHLGHILLENLESLEFASVTLMFRYYNEEVKLLRGLSNAKSVELLGYGFKKILEKESLVDFPVFEKLKSLEFASLCINEDLEPIDFFLKHTPNLEKLSLKFISMTEDPIVPGSGPHDVQCDRLKSVEIVCSRKDKKVHKLVNSLLQRLPAIQSVSVTRIDDDDVVTTEEEDDDDDEEEEEAHSL